MAKDPVKGSLNNQVKGKKAEREEKMQQSRSSSESSSGTLSSSDESNLVEVDEVEMNPVNMKPAGKDKTMSLLQQDHGYCKTLPSPCDTVVKGKRMSVVLEKTEPEKKSSSRTVGETSKAPVSKTDKKKLPAAAGSAAQLE